MSLRAEGVAISWEVVQIRTQYQEIATPSRARNDRNNLTLFFLFNPWQSSHLVGGGSAIRPTGTFYML